jgi:hypothetical protein
VPPPPAGGSSSTGAIAGGVVGGVAAILIAVFAIFYIRRRSRERSAVSAGVGLSYLERPLSDGGTYVSSSLPVSPVPMKLYVRVSVPRILFCVLICHFLSIYVPPGPEWLDYVSDVFSNRKWNHSGPRAAFASSRRGIS